MINPIKAMLFDKDGTLFDFQATWSSWAHSVITDLANGDATLKSGLARAIHFDLDGFRFLPTSPIIANTHRECAELVASVLPDRTVDEVDQFMAHSAAQAPLTPAVPLGPFLDDLIKRGISLGVMTNDTEFVAHTHLRTAGVADRFAFIAGSDSGFGAKPDPDPLLAFSSAVGIDPGHVLMVGDSTHDLIAGRAAGMQTLGVLTGTAFIDDLSPYADAVLPDIGHILAWMAAA